MHSTADRLLAPARLTAICAWRGGEFNCRELMADSCTNVYIRIRARLARSRRGAQTAHCPRLWATGMLSCSLFALDSPSGESWMRIDARNWRSGASAAVHLGALYHACMYIMHQLRASSFIVVLPSQGRLTNVSSGWPDTASMRWRSSGVERQDDVVGRCAWFNTEHLWRDEEGLVTRKNSTLTVRTGADTAIVEHVPKQRRNPGTRSWAYTDTVKMRLRHPPIPEGGVHAADNSHNDRVASCQLARPGYHFATK